MHHQIMERWSFWFLAVDRSQVVVDCWLCMSTGLKDAWRVKGGALLGTLRDSVYIYV